MSRIHIPEHARLQEELTKLHIVKQQLINTLKCIIEHINKCFTSNNDILFAPVINGYVVTLGAYPPIRSDIIIDIEKFYTSPTSGKAHIKGYLITGEKDIHIEKIDTIADEKLINRLEQLFILLPAYFAGRVRFLPLSADAEKILNVLNSILNVFKPELAHIYRSIEQLYEHLNKLYEEYGPYPEEDKFIQILHELNNILQKLTKIYRDMYELINMVL